MIDSMTKRKRMEKNISRIGDRYIVHIERRFKTLREAQEYKEKLRKQGLLRKATGNPHGRPFKNYENRYIQKYEHSNYTSYTISKKVGEKVESFGTYHSLEDAREERDFLESIDWDYSNMEPVENIQYKENKEQWRRAINE